MRFKKRMHLLGILMALFVIMMQFIQPVKENPVVDPSQTMAVSLQAPTEISTILDRSCKDCHTNNTSWPLYSYIAPISWLISHDVYEGRKHLNMSEWGKYPKHKMFNKLSGIYESVNDHSMPLPKYIPMHPEANMTIEERTILANWAQNEADKLMAGE